MRKPFAKFMGCDLVGQSPTVRLQASRSGIPVRISASALLPDRPPRVSLEFTFYGFAGRPLRLSPLRAALSPSG